MNKTNFFRVSAEDFKKIPGCGMRVENAAQADTKNTKGTKGHKGF